jgi:hypothetical protein
MNQNIISRSAAKTQGLKRYFTGKPCSRGHLTERQVSSGWCLSCLKAKSKRWRTDYPDRLRASNRSGRLANLEERRAYGRQWSRDNKDKVSAIAAARRARKLQALPAWANRAAIKHLYTTRPEGFHVDHIVPLAGLMVCGLHVHWNLQHLPAVDNCEKFLSIPPGAEIDYSAPGWQLS